MSVVGVGVGIPATIGPSEATGVDADGMGVGSSDDGTADADAGGSELEPAGLEVVGAGDVATPGDEVVGEAWAFVGPGLATAMPPPCRVGETNPAVSATVARMRLRSPMATTRRAR